MITSVSFVSLHSDKRKCIDVGILLHARRNCCKSTIALPSLLSALQFFAPHCDVALCTRINICVGSSSSASSFFPLHLPTAWRYRRHSPSATSSSLTGDRIRHLVSFPRWDCALVSLFICLFCFLLDSLYLVIFLVHWFCVDINVRALLS